MNDTYTSPSNGTWHPGLWRQFAAAQQPVYDNQDLLRQVTAGLHTYPPLVFSGEVDRLKQQLKEAARGQRFILQGGDCAERFQDCNADAIARKLKIMLQMSLILTYGARRAIVRIGRIAGQYGKPRSQDFEIVAGESLPVFRGDNVNAFDAASAGRAADPQRLLQGYYNAAMTLNFIRAMLAGGFADLNAPEHWNVSNIASGKVRDRYADVIDHIKDALSFVRTIGGDITASLQSVDFFTSHEGLILPFEEAMTRRVPYREPYYDLSAHMLWIGDRTRQLDGAHAAFFAGVANPIGIKVGPTAEPTEIIDLIRKLNPANEEGKIVLITRFGREKVSEHLPIYIDAVKHAQLHVVWSVDPMHGNMIKSKQGIKTRDFDAILSEVAESFRIHQRQRSILAGVHFEMTGDDVTECIGGAEELSEDDLTKNYESYCDPRLNYSQSLEMAFLISSMFQQVVS